MMGGGTDSSRISGLSVERGRSAYQVDCGDGMCGLGFCAPGATCETCARDCGECGLPDSASAADAGPRRR
jgi:hypothetical protein